MQSNLFLIGSGFTHSVFPAEAPLNFALMGKMREEYSHIWDILYERYGCDDVEIALTKLDLELTTNKLPSCRGELLELRHKAESNLAEFFYQFSAGKVIEDNIGWVDKFICSVFHPGDFVVCLNYDCLIEGLLDRQNLWSPIGGYGSIRNRVAEMDLYEESPIKVLKIHGSSSFIRKPVGGSNIEFSIGFVINDFLFPSSGKDKQFGFFRDQAYQAIIAPSFVKKPTAPLLSAMCDSMDAAASASNFIIIGCGLRPEDGFLMLLLRRFVQQALNREIRIVIVDPNGNEIKKKRRERGRILNINYSDIKVNN